MGEYDLIGDIPDDADDLGDFSGADEEVEEDAVPD